MEGQTPLALGPGAREDGFGSWIVPASARSPIPHRRPNDPLRRVDRDGLKQATLDARSALQEAAVAAAVAAQRAFAYAEKLDEALAALQRAERAPVSIPKASRALGANVAGDLSPREREVLALVAEGRSNKATAEALFVSPNTVKSHVASLLTKLHADSRAQLAVMAVRGTLS